jgi:lipopolysaccharide export system protein LptA
MSGATTPGSGQDVEMTAPVMDFIVKGGHQLELAETSGPPRIVISQPDTKQMTVVTADRFTAKFTDTNRISVLHGESNAKIVGSAPGQIDRVSTSPMLDAVFLPQGGISTITQAGGLTYVSGPQKAWAERGTYTDADQMLVLSGSPRVVDGGLTTTAQTIRFNRTTGDAVAEGNVKSTYSDLKAQPDGGMLASSDPIHVVSQSMTAHRSSAVATYTGNARLWQNSNVVEAPRLQFDRDHRSLVAESSPTQLVKTVLVQVDKTGKVTPVVITSAHLTYTDAERKVLLDGGVTAKGADAILTARQMTIFLVARSQSTAGARAGRSTGAAPNSGLSSLGSSGQVEKIVAENEVVVTQPTRRATGDRLVYTAADDKSVLTGGPPSIFDAEHGKITGDSLTFYRHDDRVLVEGRITSPSVTRTQVAR